VIDLSGEAQVDDVAESPRYLPKILPPTVINWLDQSLIAGRVPWAEFKLRGPIKEFPYDHGEGEFLMRFNFVDGVLDYAPEWPLLTDASGQVVFDGVSMYSKRNALTISGIKIKQADVRIDDIRAAVLIASGDSQAQLTNVLKFLQDSPVGEALGPVFDDVYAQGTADATLELVLPIKDMSQWKLDAQFHTEGATLGLDGIAPQFTNLSGSGTVSNTQITIPEAHAILLGEPVSITVRPATEGETDFSHRADIKGTLQVSRAWEAFGLPATDLLDGAVEVDAQALFPVGGEGQSLPFRILLSSDMAGSTSILPYPLYKQAADTDSAQVELWFPDQGVIDFSGSLQRGFKWVMRLHDRDSGWGIERGLVSRDETPLVLPDEPGLSVTGYIEALVLNDWLNAFESNPSEKESTAERFSDWQHIFGLVDLQIGELYAVNHRFVAVDVRARPQDSAWDVVLTGPWVEGQLTVPFDFTGADRLSLDMQRLLLIEPLEGEDEEASVPDPRTLPAMHGHVEEFALGKLRLGKLDLDVRRTDDGLITDVLHAETESFTIDASADWIVVENAQRTRLHLELQSNDVERTLFELGYSPLISAKRASVGAQLLWEGPPGMAMLYESTGQVNLTIRDGVVKQVDPGSGRLLGLMSVTSLPRLSDVAGEGLIFDKIKGDFRIDFGDAWTCNLGLEGGITDMGIVGRTGILAEDYDQVAAVRPHVSNLAPVAGAFLAGPAVGFATLLITQIFKKPLSGVGETYFTLGGTWEDPLVTQVDRSQLDTTSYADCEAQLPELSPEEIRAIEELMVGGQDAAMESAPPSEQSPATQVEEAGFPGGE
jgi:uncharacterized protein (TIGR02099 family)